MCGSFQWRDVCQRRTSFEPQADKEQHPCQHRPTHGEIGQVWFEGGEPTEIGEDGPRGKDYDDREPDKACLAEHARGEGVECDDDEQPRRCPDLLNASATEQDEISNER